jgi:hypothetical protein
MRMVRGVTVSVYRSSVRPRTHDYIELGYWRRIQLLKKDGGAVQICAPGRAIHAWKFKHQVVEVMGRSVGKVRFLRHHVNQRARGRSTQLFLVDCGLNPIEDLSFRESSQYHPGRFHNIWQDGQRSWGVEALRAPILGIPKLRVSKWGQPRSPHQTNETVLAFHCGLIVLLSHHPDLGILRYGRWGRSSRQRYLGIPVHPVLFNRGHTRIRLFSILCLHPPRRAQHGKQCQVPPCDPVCAHSPAFSIHLQNASGATVHRTPCKRQAVDNRWSGVNDGDNRGPLGLPYQSDPGNAGRPMEPDRDPRHHVRQRVATMEISSGSPKKESRPISWQTGRRA